ncbi:MAG: CotH kinase family protein [Maribacter sp.]|nr:CotH kinase family protein [Maribacter sp.]
MSLIHFRQYPLYILFSFMLVCCSTDSISVDDGTNTKVSELPSNVLPNILINTNGNTIVDDPKVPGTIQIKGEGIDTFTGSIAIEIRGASSQMFPKKSYGFETRDSNNQDLDVSLLGLPAEEDWILHGPYSDKSLMRNMLIYDLSRDMGRYTSRAVFVELTINGGYHGIYLLMEKLKRDDVRIAIDRLSSDENTGENLTGGYILKIDKLSGSNFGEGYNSLNSFSSVHPPINSPTAQITFLYEYPDAEDITEPQREYISSYIHAFENALASENFADPDIGYSAYIDVPSFIDFFLMNELSNNVDGYRISTYMHKDRNQKLNMGPIWDFNLAFGNADYCNGGDFDVWAYTFNERCPGDFLVVPFWWHRLLQDPLFATQVKQRWQVLRGSTFSEAEIFSKLTDYTTLLNLDNGINNNFNTWGVLGNYVWPNNFVGNTHQEELEYLRQWIQNRLGWLDEAINAL